MTGQTWIMVADSARARVFKLGGHVRVLELVQEFLHPASRTHKGNDGADGNKTSFGSAGPGRHAISENISPKEHEESKFCKTLADAIEAARMEGRFARLVLVAGPSLLGELRKMLSEPVRRLVLKEIDKNLTHMNEADILKHLPVDL